MRKYKTIAALLASPARWTQRAIARRKDGHEQPNITKATAKVCLIGAIEAVYGGETKQFDKVYSKLQKEIRDDLAKYNDTHDYKDVIALVSKVGV